MISWRISKTWRALFFFFFFFFHEARYHFLDVTDLHPARHWACLEETTSVVICG